MTNKRAAGRRSRDYSPATKPTKALVAAVVTLAGLVGIHLTTGGAELAIMVAQLVLVVYGVWRARNAPKDTGDAGDDVAGRYLS